MWRLQNDFSLAANAAKANQAAQNEKPEDEEPSFTEIVLDVKPSA
jgi:twitching motility protein PilU